MRLRIALLAIFAAGAALVWFLGLNEYLTFESLKENREALLAFVQEHYVLSVLAFGAAVLSTALFAPGAIAMTLAGGFLFGVLRGTLYMVASATAGAALAFLLSRNVIGNWVQQRFQRQLRIFNEEVGRHGHSYLITMRIVPVLPFFMVNYFAGITRMPLSIFVVSTAIGMLPGSVVYTFAGKELGRIESPGEIMTAKLVAALTLLGVFAMLPVVYRHAKRLRK